MELRGQRIKAGDKVVTWYISANRDPEVFDDPYTFDVTRTPNDHVTFGPGGPHFCLGAHLARLETMILFQELIPRIDTIELTGRVERIRSDFVTGSNGCRSVSKSRSFAGAPLLVLVIASGCSDPRAGTEGPIAEAPLSPSPVSSQSPSPVLHSSASPSPLPSAGARDRLITLGDTWFETRATVAYNTVGVVEGQPVSTHQCLRQMSENEINRTALLRMCNRQGSLRLTWDPPDRWRMEVITPLDRFLLTSTSGRTRICPSGDPHACRTIPTADAIAEDGADVFFQRPAQILDAIGATEVAAMAPPSGKFRVSVECFAASGRVEHVEWCYSRDGLLLSFLRGSASDGWTSIDAISVARQDTG